MINLSKISQIKLKEKNAITIPFGEIEKPKKEKSRETLSDFGIRFSNRIQEKAIAEHKITLQEE
jgi:hypothetical protein